MTDWLTVGPSGLRVRLRRHAGARRFVLRVPGAGGPPVLTIPASAPQSSARRFAEEQAEWLAERLAARPAAAAIAEGVQLPVAGRTVTIARAQRLSLDLEAGRLDLPGPAAAMPAQAAALLRARARDACAAAVARHAAALGRRHGRISLRDPRGRWGSCSSRGDLMFSWRLAMAPPRVLDYVAAHEVAHLAEMNHGPRFWAAVARLCPGHEAERAWLRREGAGLHRYAFRIPAEGA